MANLSLSSNLMLFSCSCPRSLGKEFWEKHRWGKVILFFIASELPPRFHHFINIALREIRRKSFSSFYHQFTSKSWHISKGAPTTFFVLSEASRVISEKRFQFTLISQDKQRTAAGSLIYFSLVILSFVRFPVEWCKTWRAANSRIFFVDESLFREFGWLSGGLSVSGREA